MHSHTICAPVFTQYMLCVRNAHDAYIRFGHATWDTYSNMVCVVYRAHEHTSRSLYISAVEPSYLYDSENIDMHTKK